jgi:gas vesicle protein
MEPEDTLGNSDSEVETIEPARRPAGFTAGLLLGVILGAGLALLYAPEEGEKTRGRLRRGIGVTRKELLRRKRRLRAELERIRERAKETLD